MACDCSEWACSDVLTVVVWTQVTSHWQSKMFFLEGKLGQQSLRSWMKGANVTALRLMLLTTMLPLLNSQLLLLAVQRRSAKSAAPVQLFHEPIERVITC